MRELNISTFIQVMQIGLKEHDTQFAAGIPSGGTKPTG